jgi:outer membrane protein assembly factor BamD
VQSHSIFRYAALTLFAITLAACSGDNKDEKIAPDESVETLYNRASDLMDKGQYTDAAKQFAEVERQHPYSQWATRAQLMEAYADYQDLNYDEAVKAVDGFIELHPGNPQVAYAYYLKALCSYERIADVRRDQSYAKNALKQMQDVVSRFPETVYAKDAIIKIDLIHDHLAGADMEIGRWYMSQKLYIAAIGRFRTVVEKYQTTSHVPEALERLVECYIALGITKEAKATASVLGYNFPGSDWYEDAYNLLAAKHLAPEPEPDSWIGGVWHSVF